MNVFRKPNEKEIMRKNDKELRKTQRDLERDRGKLEREEKKLEMEIKKAAKRGDKQTCTILAKQLVNMRKTKTRSYGASAKVTAVKTQAKTMQSTKAMATAMGNTTKAMGAMNKQMSPQQIAQTMQNFERESAKMAMTEEIMDDTLEDLLTESGDEEEQEAIVTQVLDEIGIEVSGKLSEAPSAHKGSLAESNAAKDAELEAKLANLLKDD
ncbi:charged multivesicular body protein 2b-like [Anneissia japonica]|uniref:charged multivesicular body protein 2b-like n=1 Tax=Anneissia japonica TaxID=1529436 RepID=UPI0014254F1A|nr:charged multivesicular body protein 2b-like [Anneissia japonica]